MENKNNYMLDNFFDKTTILNHKLMNIISTDHLTALKTRLDDIEIKKIHERFEPAYDNFVNYYANWVVSKYSYKFELKKINGILDDLSSFKIYQWEKKIQNLYSKNSAEYLKLFPQGLQVYISGEMIEKIFSVKQLAEKIKEHSELEAYYKDINDFYILINNAFNSLKKKEDEVEHDFKLLEEARSKLADIMFKNYGLLIDKYSDVPQEIGYFYKFDIIFNSSSSQTDKIYNNEFTQNNQILKYV